MSSIDKQGNILFGGPDPNRPEATVEEVLMALGKAIDALRQTRKLNPAVMEVAIKGIYVTHRAACAAALQKEMDNDTKH